MTSLPKTSPHIQGQDQSLRRKIESTKYGKSKEDPFKDKDKLEKEHKDKVRKEIKEKVVRNAILKYSKELLAKQQSGEKISKAAKRSLLRTSIKEALNKRIEEAKIPWQIFDSSDVEAEKIKDIIRSRRPGAKFERKNSRLGLSPKFVLRNQFTQEFEFSEINDSRPIYHVFKWTTPPSKYGQVISMKASLIFYIFICDRQKLLSKDDSLIAGRKD